MPKDNKRDMFLKQKIQILLSKFVSYYQIATYSKNRHV